MPELRPTGPDPTFDSRVEEIVRRVARAELARLAGPAAAEARAQERGGGLGIENIRRGVGYAELTALGANITVAAATSGFAGLSTPLAVEVVLSGRPIVIKGSLVASNSGGGALALDFLLRGERAVGGSSGAAYNNASGFFPMYPWAFLPAPSPGPARVELVADAYTGDATIYADADNHVRLLVMEV